MGECEIEDIDMGVETVEEELVVAQHFFGKIIGTKGETVKQLQEDSGAKIDIEKNEKEPKVRIRGEKYSVELAKDLILALIEEAELETKEKKGKGHKGEKGEGGK